MIWLSIFIIVILNVLLFLLAFAFSNNDAFLSERIKTKLTIKDKSLFRRVFRLKNRLDGSPLLYIHIVPFFVFLLTSILFIPFLLISFYTGFLPEETLTIILLIFISPVVVHFIILSALYFVSFYSLR